MCFTTTPTETVINNTPKILLRIIFYVKIPVLFEKVYMFYARITSFEPKIIDFLFEQYEY